MRAHSQLISSATAATSAANVFGPAWASVSATAASTIPDRIRSTSSLERGRSSAGRTFSSVASLVIAASCTRAQRKPAEAAVARAELADGGLELLAAEIGPVAVDEHELSIGRLPEKEIGQPHLAAGADEQVGIRQPGGVELAGEALRRDIAGREPACGHLLGEPPRR